VAVGRRGGKTPVYAVKGAAEAVLDACAVTGVRVEQTDAGPSWAHPGRAARLVRGRETFGWLGEAHPRVRRAFEIDAAVAVADLDLEALRRAGGGRRRVQPISRFPTVTFDLAVVVDARTAAADVEATLRKAGGPLVREVRLFDAYEGRNLAPGTRSLAFALAFGSMERTLDGAEVDRLRSSVLGAIAKRGWTVRAGGPA
jgi:phenylalanyl-tRNA synthetase beta chain